MERYNINCLLGQGAYAIVYDVTRLVDDKSLAMKIFNITTPENIVKSEIENTRYIMSRPNRSVINIVEMFKNEKGQSVIVMEKLGGGADALFLVFFFL